MGYRDLVGDWLQRKLQPATPETFIEGGGNQDRPSFQASNRDRERLDKYESAYREGGPVAQLLDTRALMTFGTGSEFITDDEEKTIVQDGEELSVADWLKDTLPQRDNLFVKIGRDAYIYGDSFLEIVETKGGEFSHIVLINPKTIEPRWDNHGTVRKWVQTIDARGPGMADDLTVRFDGEDIGHVALQRLGRHPMGVSLIGRNWDEIRRFARNQAAIEKSLERHGYGKWHVLVGREGGQAMDDNELRRHRRQFQQVKGNDAIVTGRDVDIQPMDTGGAVGDGISKITENDLTMLAAGFGVPEEMAGLGRGSTEATAKVRLQAFERTARAEQRAMADQFIDQVVRPILDEYSPFPRDIDIGIEFGDVVSDQQATSEWMRAFKGVMTPDEMRERLGLGPIPDDVDESDLGVPGNEGETPSQSPFDLQGRGTGNRSLADGGFEPWEQTYHDLYEQVLWSDDTTRQLFAFDDEDVPEFVKEKLQEVIRDEGIFSDFETVPSSARMDLQSALLDSLETQHGWSITSLRDNLQDAVPDLSDMEAERIARTETQNLVAQARERGYQERLGDDARFKWTGPNDDRTTEACEWIKNQIDEDQGVTLERLKELIQQANDKFIDHAAREFTPHIQCRHTFVRVVR